MNNLVSIFTELKLKGKVCPWLTNKFDGVQVFTFGLDSGSLGAGVLIVVNSSLEKHVCKVSKVLGQLLSIKFLFKNKLSVSILGFYTGASSVVQFSQAGKINSFIAKAVNESFFVILGGNFNEDGSHKCASFKKCFDLGLINSLEGSSFVKLPTWYNSHGITKTIDYMFISSNLVGMVVDCGVDGIEDYFDTNYKAVYVSVGLGGLLDVQLNSLHKQANRDCWKYDIKNASEIKWSEFRVATAANAVMFSNEFVMILLAGGMFKKKWFKSFDCVFNKVSSWFHKLELLVSKLVKTSQLVSGGDFALLLDIWNRLNSVGTLSVKFLFFSDTSFDAICSELAKTKKSYCSSKLLESKHAEESHIRQAIERRIESFDVNKSHTIRSVLECPFCKVVLDYLVDSGELVLEPDLVKSKVEGIMEGWTRKCVVASDISGNWARQFRPLNHVFDGAFSDVMHSIGFDKMFGIISNLPDGKVAGLSVSMIPKSYKWEGVFTNTCLIALIKTARKVLSKILSDQISLACSTFDVLYGDNFFVLKDTSIQSPIFAIGSVIKDALEKNQELWLVLQDMCKAYDSVGWKHLKRSLIRIKMCDKFIRFFGSIHNGCTNRVMTDFGLTDEYHRKVFLPLLWCIFYDLLLCEVKRQESICAGLILFLAAGAFVDDTIWVSSSQAAIQYILNIASNFFRLNDISINNDKPMAISINCWVTAPYLTISNMPISIAKRGEPHYYLGIFLSFAGFLKPSLVKVHSDVRFFVNLILRKAISDKQFAYLVSSVLFFIISYRTQFSFIPLSVCNKWDALICKGLKSKSGLPLDFFNDVPHHLSLYNLKTFKQIQAESKSASVIAFANSVGVLGCLFSHRFYDLQVLSWCSHHSLLFPVCVRISSSNNFLAGVICIFSGCDLFLGGSLASAFHLQSSTPMFLVLSKTIFFKCHWKRLDLHDPVPSWFDLSVHFLGGVASSSGHFSYEGVCGSSDIHQSLGFGVICNDLLNVGTTHLSVYTDGSLSNLGTVDVLAGAAVFFENIDSGLGVAVSGLVFSTLVELQAIALALECVPSFHSVNLFSDSQAALDACRSEFLSVGPDFRNRCWIERRHIANAICHKNLNVNWIKVKGHSGVSGNKQADALAKDVALSAWHLLHLVNKRFLKTGVNTVSGNSRHFVYNIFRSINRTHWEVGSGSQVVLGCLYADIDWLRSSLVWHLDSHMCLYDKGYPSVVCLFCGKVEVSDHVFFCSSDTDSHTGLLDTYAAVWKVCSGLSRSFSCISHTALCKGFVFSDWYCKSVSVYKNPKVAVVNVVNFVRKFCLAFHDNIWLVHVKHRAIMKKNKLIPHDGSISVAVSGFSMWLSAGMIRLLNVADALGISFGYHKHCLFYAGVGNMASVHISV
ncbi:hypothetical protein G9A89_013179 [Geosiphon pyriformis]|nr:hypothetical protein G9A89_013179 [Geosiphon pyriformis]